VGTTITNKTQNKTEGTLNKTERGMHADMIEAEMMWYGFHIEDDDARAGV